MIYLRCKCGAYEAWDGGVSPPPCTACEECGTVPGGEAPIPHEYRTQGVETDEGAASLTRCRYCLRTRAMIERAVKGGGR